MAPFGLRIALAALVSALAGSPGSAQQQAQQPLSPADQESTAAARVDEYLRCMSGCKDVFPGGELEDSRIVCVRGCRDVVAPLPATAPPPQRER